MLGVPDAYELPRSPGHGYLKFGTEPLIRFRAAYVSGVVPAGRRQVTPAARPVRPGSLPFTTHVRRRRRAATEADAASSPDAGRARIGETLLDVVVERLAGPAGRRRTRSGCRRWTSRRRWTSCCRRSASTRSAG